MNGCLSLGAVNPLIDTADLEKRKNYCNIYSKEDPIHVFTVLHITIHHQKEKCPKKVVIPPGLGPHFGTCSTTFEEKHIFGRAFLKTFFLHPFWGEQNRKRDDPGPLECGKTIVITCVSATSPHGGRSYEKDALGLHFGGLLGPLLPLIGHQRQVRGRFFGGRHFE